jgi:hypothetical protein
MSETWLIRPTTFDDAIRHLSHTGVRRAEQSVERFRKWFSEHFKSGDVLWWYDNGGWDEMAGENGFAVVRNDVIAYMYPLMQN